MSTCELSEVNFSVEFPFKGSRDAQIISFAIVLFVHDQSAEFQLAPDCVYICGGGGVCNSRGRGGLPFLEGAF